MNGHVAGTPHHSASTKFVLFLIAAVTLIAIGAYVGSTMNGPSRIQETNSPAASATSENQESGSEEDPAADIDVDEPEPATSFSWEDIGHAPNTPQENFASNAMTANKLESELFVESDSTRVLGSSDMSICAELFGVPEEDLLDTISGIEADKDRAVLPDGYVFYCQVKSPDGSYRAHVLSAVLQPEISTPRWLVRELARQEL
jgi:hypothetical protein